ncbi:hypothetical protein ACFOEQ_07620 [Chryseobacterium arachidis]|uniref:hypothetical protein n=1 Tax=Chryseobacterium arachidis TaxID=1416778 RepID=UPI003612DEE6
MQHFRHYILLFLIIPLMAFAEDGSQLWLRYPVNPKPRNIVNSNSKSPTIEIAKKKELNQHWAGQAIDLKIDRLPENFKDGYKIVSTPKKISILAKTDLGLLYGSYHLLNLQQQKADFSNLKLEEKPSYDVRILNHWDNLDGTIERGYAGHSLWKWEDLPNKISPRYEEYARANASIGINATVLNNVNASPNMLREDYLKKVKVLADIFRPYGIKVYLSVNFSSPKVLGGLQNSDPLNQDVQKWWKDKAAEIYKLIPDFGGFFGKSQFRRPARTAGLRKNACRWSEYDGRCPETLRWNCDVEGIRVQPEQR